MLRHCFPPPTQNLRARLVIVTLVTCLVSAASASGRPVRWRSPGAQLGDAGVELPARPLLPASFRERTGRTDYRVQANVRDQTLGTPGADRTVHPEESVAAGLTGEWP